MAQFSAKLEQVKTELGAVALCVAANLAFLLSCAVARPRFSLWEFWIFFIWGEVWFSAILIWLLNHHFALWRIKAIREAYKDGVEIRERLSKLSGDKTKTDKLRLLLDSLVDQTKALQVLLMDIVGTAQVSTEHVDEKHHEDDQKG